MRPIVFISIIAAVVTAGCGQDRISNPPVNDPSPDIALRRTAWQAASRPLLPDDTLAARGCIAWYNPREPFSYSEIWNRRNSGNPTVVTLRIEFRPVNRVLVPDIPEDRFDTILVEPERTWGGFTTYLPRSLAATMAEVQYLDIRLRGDVGIMHLDLGRIREDVNGNGNRDTEDKNGNGILDDGEDTGLDGFFDEDEFGYNPLTNPDPSGDDWDPNDVWKINGTEGNADDLESGGRPDTEDPDFDGLYRGNSYFTYRIDLSDTTRFYVKGTRNNSGWRTIRIPLRSIAAMDGVFGGPLWDNIHQVRIWFDSASAEYLNRSIVVDLAAIEPVVVSWESYLFDADSLRGGATDFAVSYVDYDLDARYYASPQAEGGGWYPRGVLAANQTLALTYQNLANGLLIFSPDSGLVLAADTALAVRELSFSQNYADFNWLHLFANFDYCGADSALFMIRLGIGPEAYFEYRSLVTPSRGWHDLWFSLATFSALKEALLSQRLQGDSLLVLRDSSGGYLVKIDPASGAPDFRQISYVAMGVINLMPDRPLTGEIWVEKLRLY